MKKIKVVQLAIFAFMISLSLWSCDNNSDAGMDDTQPASQSKLSTRNGSTFQVMTFSVNKKIYRANQTATIDCAKLRNEPVTQDDWGNAIYFWDTNIQSYLDMDHPFFIEATFKKTFRVIDTDYEGFMDGNYDMNYVISNIEKIVGSSKPANKPFLQWLGEKGYAIRYYENLDREIAIAIPHSLLDDNLFSQKVIARY